MISGGGYVDVHTHLTHSAFDADLEAVISRAEAAGCRALVVNGLEPVSNRAILTMADRHAIVRTALGIYPIDAVNQILPPGLLPFPVERFAVDEEIAFIARMAAEKRIAAIGECGLDGHWVDDTFAEAQELVFVQLIDIAVRHDLPIIVHSRKKEQRCRDLLVARGARKVNFHCFGGKVRMAEKFAREDGYWFSIPANAERSESFRKMLTVLPADKLLTETDAPYLSAVKGQRTEPANVVGTVNLMAALRGISPEQAKEQVWANYLDLFGAE